MKQTPEEIGEMDGAGLELSLYQEEPLLVLARETVPSSILGLGNYEGRFYLPGPEVKRGLTEHYEA